MGGLSTVSKKIVFMFLILLLLFTGMGLGVLKGMEIKETEYREILKKATDNLNKLKAVHREEEKDHARRIQTLEDQLARNQEDYITSLDGINTDHAERLRQSESRLRYYKSIGSVQETGASECTALISVTGTYDANLTEGIRVVKELRGASTRVLEDLRTMTKIVEEDRELINN